MKENCSLSFKPLPSVVVPPFNLREEKIRLSNDIWASEIPFAFECGDAKFGIGNHTTKYIIASLEQPQSMLGIPMPDKSTHHNSQRNHVSHNVMSLHSIKLHLTPIFHQTSVGNSVNASIGIYINIPTTHKQIHLKSCFNAAKMHMFLYFIHPYSHMPAECCQR